MMIKIGLLVLASALVVMAQVHNAKFNLKQCTMAKHTRNCQKPVLESSFTQREREELFNHIAGLRSWVTENGMEKHAKSGELPAAAVVAKLRWDDELARQALTWASQCKSGLDPCLTSSPGIIGQTKTSLRSAKKFVHPLQLVNQWYDEVKDFDRKLIPKFNPDPETFNKISNFTQIVWGKTQKVGCGRIVEEVGDDLYQTTLVCNWEPAGNIFGKYVYRIHPALRNDYEKKTYDTETNVPELTF